jgi:hypothetical protein
MNAPNVVSYFNHPDNHQINMRFKNGAISNLNFVMYAGETDHSDPLLEMLDKQADDGHFLQYSIFGTEGAIETDVFRRRIRRRTFSDGPKYLINKIVETITFPKSEDQEWFHNTHGQNLRIAELVALGLSPENPASDAYETMKAGFAAEISEREKRIVKMSEFEEYDHENIFAAMPVSNDSVCDGKSAAEHRKNQNMRARSEARMVAELS